MVRTRGYGNAVDVAAVLAAAALAHDLGNPPFGHSGEKAIGHCFEHGAGRGYLEGLSAPEIQELIKFEGNALGFRILTRHKRSQTTNPGGMGLTYATLATFTKYPCTVDAVNSSSGVARKKFGIFTDDAESWREIARKTGLRRDETNGWARHPLAFLLEAADDICYRVMDLEDGFRLRLVDGEQVEFLLSQIARAWSQSLAGRKRICDRTERIGFLRAKAINSLVHQCGEVFKADLSRILEGRRTRPLLDDVSPSTKRALKEVERITAEKLYSEREVVEIEAAGFEVLPKLLEQFLPAALAKRPDSRAAKLRALIPSQFLHTRDDGSSQQARILDLCEFVASMTDSYAIDLYRSIYGIALRNYG